MTEPKQLAKAALGLGLVLMITAVARGDESRDALIDKLKDSKHSLVEGIQQAETASGYPISAKFELEGSNLMLSVYTAKAGLGKDAEHNVLTELNGEAAAATWAPAVEVFTDAPHIARASGQLTLMQLSRLNLKQIIKKASYSQPGTVYSVTPMVKNGQAICEVLIATPFGVSVAVNVPLQ